MLCQLLRQFNFGFLFVLIEYELRSFLCDRVDQLCQKKRVSERYSKPPLSLIRSRCTHQHLSFARVCFFFFFSMCTVYLNISLMWWNCTFVHQKQCLLSPCLRISLITVTLVTFCTYLCFSRVTWRVDPSPLTLAPCPEPVQYSRCRFSPGGSGCVCQMAHKCHTDGATVCVSVYVCECGVTRVLLAFCVRMIRLFSVFAFFFFKRKRAYFLYISITT